MSAILFVLVLALAFYTFFGILFADVFSLAPIFLSIALICLFLALKQVLAEVRALYELLHMELDDIKEKLSPDGTEETKETDESDGTEETDEATETKEPDETKE